MRVSLGTEQPGRKLDVWLNHAELGSITAPVKKGGFADSQPQVLNLKAGLNLLRLHVPTNRPYDIESLKITAVGGPALKNTLPQTTFNGFQRDIEPGGSYAELFNVSDAETKAEDLKVTATSTNQALLPASSIKIETGEWKNQWGTTFNRRFTVTPVGATGEGRVLITVEDAGSPADKTVAPLRRTVAMRVKVQAKAENK